MKQFITEVKDEFREKLAVGSGISAMTGLFEKAALVLYLIVPNRHSVDKHSVLYDMQSGLHSRPQERLQRPPSISRSYI